MSVKEYLKDDKQIAATASVSLALRKTAQLLKSRYFHTTVSVVSKDGTKISVALETGGNDLPQMLKDVARSIARHPVSNKVVLKDAEEIVINIKPGHKIVPKVRD